MVRVSCANQMTMQNASPQSWVKQARSVGRYFFAQIGFGNFLQAPIIVYLPKPPADTRSKRRGPSGIPAFAGMTAVGGVGGGLRLPETALAAVPHPGPLPGERGKSSVASLRASVGKSRGAAGRDGHRPQPRRIHHTSRASRTPRASATFMTAPKRVFWPGRASRSWSP